MPWRIWIETFINGKKVGSSVFSRSYEYKHNATRMAKKRFSRKLDYWGQTITYNWVVSQTNPWEKGE